MVLLPVFFAFSGLNANLLELVRINLLIPSLVMVVFAFAGKYLSSLFTLRLFSNLSWRESSAIGGLINSRGLMALIIANIGLSYKIIDEHVYSILALIAVTTTLAALPIYNWSIGKQKT